MHGNQMLASIGSSNVEVFFTEAIYYYQYVNQDLFLDITDIVTTPNAEDGNKTILSKMSDVHKDYLKTEDNKYFAIPHYSSFSGLMYDKDLFADRNLYFSGAEGREGRFVSNKTEVKSAGPDGQKDTYDDGLAATYAEFFKLCDEMLKKGITPFVWTGEYVGYYNWFLGALQADYEGIEQMQLLYNLDGTAKNLVSVSANGAVTRRGDVEITNANGYEMYAQEGRYQALKFMETMISKPTYYYSKSFNSTFSHRNAQTNFLLNGATRGSEKRIGMLMEGIWWEEEAKADFAQAAKSDDKWARENRNIGYMPLPKANADKVGEKTTLLDIGKSFAFINANTATWKQDLAKKFLAFCYTDENLAHFTKTTSSPKALLPNYMTQADYNQLSNYGKSVWDVYANADMAYPYSTNPLFLDNQDTLDIYLTYTTNSLSSALVAFHEQRATAESFFNGILERRGAQSWNDAYSRYWS